MEVSLYFRRIGFSGPFIKPDLSTLKLLHRLHIMTIPFENLSLHCGERAYLDLDQIRDKILVQNRGGWCFENNGLFGWVLRELGYKVTTLASKVFNPHLNDFSSFDNHLINKVEVEGGEYIADVSFGVSKQIWEPLELISGKEQHQETGIFQLLDKEGEWVLQKTSRKPDVLNPEFVESGLVSIAQSRPMYSFTLAPRSYEYFSEANKKLQTDPGVLFTNKSIISIQTQTGFKALVGLTYSEIRFKLDRGLDEYDMRRIRDEEVDEILKQEFGIRLKNKLQPVDRKVTYTI